MKVTEYFILRQEVDNMEKKIRELVKEADGLTRRRFALKEIVDSYENEMYERTASQLSNNIKEENGKGYQGNNDFDYPKIVD